MMDAATMQDHLARIDDQGYTIVEGAIEPELTAELRDTIRNTFVELGC